MNFFDTESKNNLIPPRKITSAILSILLLLCAMLSACSKEPSETLDPDSPIIIAPFPPELSEEITISYKPSHAKEQFAASIQLYATVFVTMKQEYQQYRLKLNRVSDTLFASMPLLIPEDAEWISISVAPKNIQMTNSMLNVPVFKNGKPVIGALS